MKIEVNFPDKTQVLEFSQDEYENQFKQVKQYWQFRNQKFQTDLRNETILDMIYLKEGYKIPTHDVKYKVIEQ